MAALTLRITKRDLGDHFLDFLNANNPNGFLPDEDTELDENSIAGILVHSALSETLGEKQFKRNAKKIKRLSEDHISHTQALELMARAMGYTNYHVVSATLRRFGFVASQRRRKEKIATKLYLKAPTHT